MTDKQLVRFATSFRSGILAKNPSNWMCAAICWPLQPLLKMAGVKCEVIESDLGHMNHVWLRLEDGRALDPTADQFNHLFLKDYPPVYLGPLLDIHGNGQSKELGDG